MSDYEWLTDDELEYPAHQYALNLTAAHEYENPNHCFACRCFADGIKRGYQGAFAGQKLMPSMPLLKLLLPERPIGKLQYESPWKLL